MTAAPKPKDLPPAGPPVSELEQRNQPGPGDAPCPGCGARAPWRIERDKAGVQQCRFCGELVR